MSGVRLRDTFRYVGKAHISGERRHGGDDVGKIGEVGRWKITVGKLLYERQTTFNLPCLGDFQ